MKKIFIKPIVLVALLAGVFTSCVKDEDAAIPSLKIPFYQERFQDIESGEIVDNTILNVVGWSNFAESGTVLWKEQIFRGDGYAEFNSYGSPDAENIAWLISPKVNIRGYQNVKFAFKSAQNFSSNAANTVEVYVSSNYDGTDVLGATWTKVEAKVADMDTTGYLFIPSGEIDLSAFEAAGHVYIAFKAIGSGTNTALDGLFQINDLYVYTAK